MDGQTDRQMDGKSPHSTGFCSLLGPLPKKEEGEKGSFGFFRSLGGGGGGGGGGAGGGGGGGGGGA